MVEMTIEQLQVIKDLDGLVYTFNQSNENKKTMDKLLDTLEAFAARRVRLR